MTKARAPSRSEASNPAFDPWRLDWLAACPPPRSLPLDAEALRIYEHAYAIGLEVEDPSDPPITFSTVVAALLLGRDDTSRWFQRLAEENGPKPEAVFDEKEITPTAAEKLRPPEGRPGDVRLSHDKHLLTSSARSVLVAAESWAQRVGRSDIGVRHLVASYVINPPAYHRRQMQEWEFSETQWREPFFKWVAERYTAELWTEVSERPAPAQAIPEIEQQEIKGESLAYPGDDRVTKVLARAAELHTRRDDPWLRLQTLWHALVDVARTDDDIRSAIKPFMDAVDKAPSYGSAVEVYFSASEKRPRVAFDALDISPRVLNALEGARQLAVATRRGGEAKVSVLHLAGGLASRRADGDDDLVAFGINPRALRLALIQHVEGKQSGVAWRESLGEDETFEGGRPLELNSDEPEAVVRGDEDWTNDPLRIRRDVQTFAALLASRSLEPPLSIGLFGPWGSGKTTFIRRLQRTIVARAREAKKSAGNGQDTPYVSDIVHVDFNAWHFSEGALTSSLVDTILRQIEKHIDAKEEKIGEVWQKQTLDQLETAQRNIAAAQAAEKAAQKAVDAAQTTVAEKEKAVGVAAVSMRSVMTEVWTQTLTQAKQNPDLRKSGALDALGTAVSSVDDLRARVEALRARPARLLGDLGWPRALLFAVLILAVPTALAWLVASGLKMGEVQRVLAFVIGAASTISLWAKSAAQAVAKVDTAVTKVADDYLRRIDKDGDVIAARTQLASAQANALTAAAGLSTAHEELARAQAAAANATLPAQMLQLVSSRIDAQTYTRELTTLSLARADLEKLSTLLRDQRKAARETPAADAASGKTLRPVERVILYIDDLDRCRPRDVVRVLQMVHMLLAFELFAVVVAVDARWVRECLRQSYRWLASDEPGEPVEARESDEPGEPDPDGGNGVARPDSATRGVSPQDYLEKIFQIAYWLEPMTVQRAADYLRSLVRTQDREASGPVTGVTSIPAIPGASVFPTVVMFPIERDYMTYLATYVGSSPRRVKRLVNAYRLIKASLPDSQLRTFLTKTDKDASGRPLSGPYQIVIGLLAIGTGAPASCAQILRDIVSSDPGDTPESLVQRFEQRDHPDWSLAARVLEIVMRTQKAKAVADLRDWALSVGRFLLNSPYDAFGQVEEELLQ